MNHESYTAFQTRLETLLNMIEAIEVVGSPEMSALKVDVRRYKAEATEIMQILVGDDPKVWESIRWLQGKYDNDLVLRQEDGQPKLILNGNEAWVFADVAIGDDYGALDFVRRHAIWRYTGALYECARDGEVAEDPIYVPRGSSYSGPLQREER